MPWNKNNEGPWGTNKGGPQPPNIEKLFKKGQDNFKKMMSGGTKGGKALPFLVVFLVFFFWLSSGLYYVDEGEIACEIRFGEFIRTTQPGLHLWWPAPVGNVEKRKVSQINRVDSGIPVKSKLALSGDEAENFMLTSDGNIIAVNFTVLWYIKDIAQYLFNDPNPEKTVKLAAESAVREIIAQTPILSAITKGKSEISEKAQKLLQHILDEYKVGIQIQEVNLQNVDPPTQVIDAFRDVQRALADRESSINEARAYQNTIVPEARGLAQQKIQQAEAYKQAVVANAQGETMRFLSVLEQYSRAPEITRKRIYIDTLSKVLGGLNKVIIDQKTQGILPYLPLPELKAKAKSNDDNTASTTTKEATS
jgi:membrane protease subunit HflK